MTEEVVNLEDFSQNAAPSAGWYPEPTEITEIELLQKRVARLGLDFEKSEFLSSHHEKSSRYWKTKAISYQQTLDDTTVAKIKAEKRVSNLQKKNLKHHETGKTQNKKYSSYKKCVEQIYRTYDLDRSNLVRGLSKLETICRAVDEQLEQPTIQAIRDYKLGDLINEIISDLEGAEQLLDSSRNRKTPADNSPSWIEIPLHQFEYNSTKLKDALNKVIVKNDGGPVPEAEVNPTDDRWL